MNKPKRQSSKMKKRRQEVETLNLNKDFYKITEVAQMTGKSYGYVAQQTRLGYLKAKGARNKIIKKEWLETWLEEKY